MYDIKNFIHTHKDIHGDGCIDEFLLPNIVDLEPNFIGMKTGTIYELGLLVGTIRKWDENLLFNELNKVIKIGEHEIEKKKTILHNYIFQVQKIKEESPNNSIVRINQNLDLEWVETKAKFLTRTRPRPKKLSEQTRTNYIELARLCLNTTDYLKFEKFARKLKDYDNNWEYGSTINCVIEYIEENNIFLFISLDWKAEIADLKGKLNLALMNNFNVTIDLPDANEYPQSASVSYDKVFYDYIQSLNKSNFDLSFIDTDSDEYIIIVHPLYIKESILNVITGIGLKELKL